MIYGAFRVGCPVCRAAVRRRSFWDRFAESCRCTRSFTSARTSRHLQHARDRERRLIHCSSATGEELETHDVQESRSRSLSFSATLITLPQELQSAIRLRRRRKDEFTRQFVLLTKDPGFMLPSEREIPSTVEDITLREDQMSMIEHLKKTELYQRLFRFCLDALWMSSFWEDAIFLPCRVRSDQSWEIAWDVIHSLVDPERQKDYESFIRILANGRDEYEQPKLELIQALQRIQTAEKDESSSRLTKANWKDIEDFLKKRVIVGPQHWPIISFSLSNDLKGTGYLTYLGVEDAKAFLKSFETRSRIKLSEESDILFPLSADWLLCFLATQTVLPKVTEWINATRVQRALQVVDDLPLASLVEHLEAAFQDNRKAVTIGTLLLRLVTLLDQWQTSNNSLYNNSKAISVVSQESIRNIKLGDRLKQMPDAFEALLEWTEIRGKDLPFSWDWSSTLFDKTNVDVRRSRGEWARLSPGQSTGRNFKALVAGCYKQAGMAGVWRLCEKIQLVQLRRRSFIQRYVQSWADKPLALSQPQKWERVFISPSNAVPDDVYREFCDVFGYEFHQKFRFDCAMRHSSLPGVSNALYRWMTIIGKAFLDLLFQRYVEETRPYFNQTGINTLFSEHRKLEIFVDVAYNLNVQSISKISTVSVIRALTRNEGDREGLKKDNSTRGYLATITMVLVGCVAWDVGFDVERVIEIIRPHFSKEIDNSALQLDPMYSVVDRCVPTELEIQHFEKNKGIFYPTLIQLGKKGSTDAVFGVYVLTKCPLPSFSEPEVLISLDEVETVLRWLPFSSGIKIPRTRQILLESFQSEWFEAILPPQTKTVPFAPQNKKYFVAPAKDGLGGPSSLDWDLIRHVVKKTVPKDISLVLKNFLKGASPTKDALQAAERVASADVSLRFADEADIGNPMEEAQRQLLFVAEGRHVVHAPEGKKDTGNVVNIQNMSSLGPLLSRSRTVVKSVNFQPSAAQCLPYTLAYFRCLSAVPALLDALERRLLAEDYRRMYNLPQSIPNQDLLLSLTLTSEINTPRFGFLVSLGHSVVQYLSTLHIVASNPGRSVGRISVLRTVFLSSKQSMKEEDEYFVMGHSFPAYMQAYKEWYPPAGPPLLFQSIHTNETATTDAQMSESLDLAPPLIVKPVKGRLSSGVEQRISKGVPQKQIKAIAALCFLHEGIEAACTYLHQIGAVGLKQYPSEVEDAPDKQPRLKKYLRLQETLQYEFRNMSTLALAFMHASAFPTHGENNEILEFLGDAVLDVCMWRYIYENYRQITLDQAARLKMDLTSNKTFAWLSYAPPLKLPSLLMQSMEGFPNDLPSTEKSKKEGFESTVATKMASDVFEALMGAVLVDSGYSIETVNKVMLRLMKEPLEDMAAFGIQDPTQTAL